MRKLITGLTVVIAGLSVSNAQDETNNEYGKGLKVIAKDSSFSMKFNTRFQTLYEGKILLDGNDKWTDKMLIRRSRFKFGGHAFSPKLTYKMEFGLSNRDNGKGSNQESFNYAPRYILDAVAKWRFADNWTLWAGQTKLPGNRERVISSQQLQFVDRSLVNSTYNIDRDIGLQLHYEGNLRQSVIRFRGALSMGEGRNITSDNKGGYAYTGRVEWLPFGKFTKKGDYSASDLQREEKPKLSLAANYHLNQESHRTNNATSTILVSAVDPEGFEDLSDIHADLMFKYKGWQVHSEWASRTSSGDGTVVAIKDGKDSSDSLSYALGTGFNIQAGYLFKKNFEFAARYTIINESSETTDNDDITTEPNTTMYTFGFSRYFRGHYLKIQSDVSIIDKIRIDDNTLMYRLQLEVAF